MDTTHYVVINTCYGGFGLSEKAIQRLGELGVDNPHDWKWGDPDVSRHDPRLVQVVKELNEEAENELLFSTLEVVEVKGDRYRVMEYDGSEWVETPDSIRWTVIE